MIYVNYSNNISTNENEDMDMDEEYVANTRIYSDCFASYQPNTFRQKGYILKRVNHSVCLGIVIFIPII